MELTNSEKSAEKLYALDIDRAKEVLRSVNSDRMLLMEDAIVAQYFANLMTCRDPDSIARCIVALDALWKTRLYEIPTEREMVCRSLEASWSEILDLTLSLKLRDLETSPGTVYAAAKKAFPVILGAKGRAKSNYSFCTKFFHWVTRQHFPIVDGLARKSISQFQKDSGKTKYSIEADSAKVLTRQYVREYSLWVKFYSDLTRSLSAEERDGLIRVDYDSQASGAHQENTLLRVLDKIFYGARGRCRLVSL